MAAPSIVDSAFVYEATAGTSTSVTAPATVNAGDLLVFIVGSDCFRTAFDITGFPSGFTPLVYTGDNDNDVHSAICYKIADGTEDGSTLTATAANSHNMWCGILRITGHDPDFPFGSRATNATGGTAGTVHTFDGLVSSRDDALCLLMVTTEATNASTPTVSTGAGTWTLLNDGNGGSVGGTIWTIEKATAGDHGSFTVTFPANNRYAGHVVEIMAQPAGTITTSNHASVSATTGSPRIYSGVSIGGNPHTVYVFPEDGSITFSAGVTADYVIVPGGGSGGDNAFFGAGGGGGGLPVSATAQSLSAGTYSITVGDGGAGGGTATVNGNTGGNSSFNSTTAYGGGYGAGNASGETTQGNGGGAGGNNSGGTSTGSGFAGGAGTGTGDRGGGGGGGANGAGEAADGTNGGGNGGAGISSEILGLTTFFGGGGGGGASAGGEFSRGGKGGLGGGGWGGSGGQQRPTSGADGLGGGSGGDCQQGTGASLYDKGGDGVVIIALPEAAPADDLTGTDAATGSPSVDTATIGQVHALSGADTSAGNPSADAPTVGQAHTLGGTDTSAGNPSVDAPTVGQAHTLGGTDTSAGNPSVDTPTLTEVINADNLTASDVATGSPSVAAPTVGQIHDLGATDTSAGSPSVDAATLGQVHALGGSDVTGGTPSADAPTLASSAEQALTATDVTSGNPTVDAPTVGQTHALGGTSTSAGNPSVSSPTASNIDALTASDVTTGTPTTDASTIGQVHELSAADEEGLDAPLTEGDVQSGEDNILLEGDAQGGTDILIYNQWSTVYSGVPTVSTPQIGPIRLVAESVSVADPIALDSFPVLGPERLTAASIATFPPTISSRPVVTDGGATEDPLLLHLDPSATSVFIYVPPDDPDPMAAEDADEAIVVPAEIKTVPVLAENRTVRVPARRVTIQTTGS